MANLRNLKPSITELSHDQRVHLVTESRKRRIGFKSKPKKKVNKKIIGKLSQEQKMEILNMMKLAEQNATNS